MHLYQLYKYPQKTKLINTNVEYFKQIIVYDNSASAYRRYDAPLREFFSIFYFSFLSAWTPSTILKITPVPSIMQLKENKKWARKEQQPQNQRQRQQQRKQPQRLRRQ